jgi:hypothetical protein
MTGSTTRIQVLALSLVILAGGGLVPAEAAETPPDAESMLADGRIEEYLSAVRGFLEEHADAPDSARVALEAMMVAAVHRKADAEKDLKRVLLLAHGDSLAGRFALTRFADAKACREFLDEVIQQRLAGLTPPLARRYMATVRRAVSFWGRGVMTDDQFLLRTALAARVAGDKQGWQQCLSQLDRDKAPVIKTTKLLFDPKIGHVQRIVALQELVAELPAAGDFVEHFYGRLDEADRSRPEILRVVAGNHLAESRFAEARPVIRRLVKSVPGDGQAVIWSAWTDAVTGDKLEIGAAVSSLRAFARKHENSKWAVTASKLATAIAGHRGRLATAVDELGKILDDWKAGQPQLVKVRLGYSPGNGPRVDGFASFDSEAKRFEVTLSRNGGVVMAASSAPQGSRLFSSSDPVVYRLDGRAIFPAPRFSITRGDDGKFEVQVGVSLGDQVKAMQDLTGTIASSPWLSKKTGRIEVWKHATVDRGWYPVEAVFRDGELAVHLVRPWITEPGFDETTIRIDRRRQKISGTFDGLDFTIAYGDARATAWLSGPRWPDVPTKATADASMIFRLLGAASSLFDDKAARTATRPKTGATR